MTAIDLRTEITQLLQQEQNASILEAIRMLLKREQDAVNDDFTDEELAELHEIDRRRLSGEDKYVSMEEAMKMAREALKK